MIKVCHMTSVHKSQDVRILKKQCTSLAKAGYEVYLVAKGESYTENGVNVVGVGEVGGGRLARMTKQAKSVYEKAIELDCDIYQIHDPELLPYVHKLKNKGKKVIFDSHEDYVAQIKHKHYIPKILRNSVANLFGVCQNSVLKRIDAVIFPCLINGKDIFEDKCKKSIILGNQPLIEELYDNYDGNNQKIANTVCYVGGLTYTRGIKHLILASAKANAKTILGGNFMPKAFEDEMVKMPEFKSVDFRGFCDRKEVLNVYKQSMIGMSTLLTVGQQNILDNFVTKIYEYMSMGLPVIMSDYPYARKINEKYNFAILVNPEDTDEIANAITYLLNNPEIAKEMGQNGRRAVLEEFNWGIEEKKLLKLYEELSR